MHWLQFRGPNASGIAPEEADPPIHFGADTNLLWKAEILPGWSSPCVVNDRIFLTGFDKEGGMLHTFAIDRETGANLWTDSVMADTLVNVHPINGYANSTVLSDGNKIFAEFSEFGMIAYDLNGERQWTFRHEPIQWFYGGACSPVLHDSTIIQIVNPDRDCRIVGLDPESGDSVWNIRASGDQGWSHFSMNSTPVFSNDLMILHFSSYLVGYDLVKRTPAWWMNLPTNGVATPVVHEGTLYLNSYIQMGEQQLHDINHTFDEFLAFYDTNQNSMLDQDEFPDSVYAFKRPEIYDQPFSGRRMNEDYIFRYFDENKDKAFDEAEWDQMLDFVESFMKPHGMLAMRAEGSGERFPSDILWKVSPDTPETPSPLVVGDRVFFIKNGGIITAIDRETGEVVAHGRLGAPGAYLSSPLLAANRIYACAFNGTVTVLSGEDFSLLAENKLKEKIGASPVAVDDVLYIRTDRHLYAFREI